MIEKIPAKLGHCMKDWHVYILIWMVSAIYALVWAAFGGWLGKDPINFYLGGVMLMGVPMSIYARVIWGESKCQAVN